MSQSNFAWAFLVLSKPQREALHALYAFCRTVDDIVDHAADPVTAQKELDRWRGILDRIGRPSSFDPPAAHQLSKAVAAFPIVVDDLRWIIDGVEMDLRKNRYESFEELLVYCDGVASAVGLASLAIFGADREKTKAYAMATGRALQLTNILRDVASDAARGRIYLPLCDLRRFACREEDLVMGLYDGRFAELMAFEVSRAKSFYAEAEEALSPAARREIPAAEIMRKTYERLLRRIEARRYDVFSGKIAIPRAEKITVAASVWARSLF